MNDSESGHKLKVFVGSSPHQRLIILTLLLLRQFSQISMRDWTLILMYVRADVICGLLRDIYVPDCALIFCGIRPRVRRLIYRDLSVGRTSSAAAAAFH